MEQKSISKEQLYTEIKAYIDLKFSELEEHIIEKLENTTNKILAAIDPLLQDLKLRQLEHP